MKRLALLMLALCSVAHGQTVSLGSGNYVSAATGGDLYPPNFFNFMPYDDLLAYSASISAPTHAYVLTAYSGTTNSFVSSSYETLATNAGNGWGVQVICHPTLGGSGGAAICSGGANGCTGTLTANTNGSGATYTFTPCGSAIAGGDIVKITPPVTGIAVTANGWGVSSGSITFSQDTTAGNLPPPDTTGLTAPNAVTQITVGSGGGQIFSQIDTSSGVTNIIINGTPTQSMYANLISSTGGNCTVVPTTYRAGGANYFTGATPSTLTSGWNLLSWNGSASETASTAPGNITGQFQFGGTASSCVIDVIDLEFHGAAGCTVSGFNPCGTLIPYAHTNASPFRDYVVNLYKNYGEVRYNYAYSNSAIAASYTLNQLLSAHGRRPQNTVSPNNYTSPTGIGMGLTDILQLAKAAGITRVEYSVPITFTASDYANLMQYLGDSNCADTWAAIRCNQGQTTPWTSVMTSIALPNNETWNANSPGQYLGQGYFTAQFALAIINATAIKASPYYSSVVKVGATIQPSSGNQALKTAADPNNIIDFVDMAGYSMMDTNNVSSQSLLLQNALTEAWAAANDSWMPLYQIGLNGTPQWNYEVGPGAVTGACTTTSCSPLFSGLGQGLVEPARIAYLQRKFSNFLHWNQWNVTNGPTTGYSSSAGTTPATTVDLWSKCQNLRGPGAACDPSYYDTALYNAAASLGNGIQVNIVGQPTFNNAAHGTLTASFASGYPAVMTVTAVGSGSVSVGDALTCPSCGQGTYVYSAGSGTGGTGTYNVLPPLSGGSQTVTSGNNGVPAEPSVPLVDFWAFAPGTGSGPTSTTRAYYAHNADSVAHTLTLSTGMTLSGTVTQTIVQSSNSTPALTDNNRTLGTLVVAPTTTTAAAATSYVIPAFSTMLLQGAATGGTTAMIYQFIPGPY